MLFLLITAQRCQTLYELVSDIKFSNGDIVITPSHMLKQMKPDTHLEPIVLKVYVKKELCIVNMLTESLKRTKAL